MTCKFTRYMLRTTFSSVHISQANFIFVPMLDFHESWNDKKLYEYFTLTEEEQDLIESTMRPMDLTEEEKAIL